MTKLNLAWKSEECDLAQPDMLAQMFHDAPCDVYRSRSSPSFSDPFVAELLSSAPLQRLAGIGFLGAIDYLRHSSGSAGHRRRHNRLEHSLGVAWLADVYAREADLPDDRRRLLICASLLHDVGHGPLSHTLEPVFADVFGIDHHSVTRDIVTGDLRFGEEIPAILSDADVDIDEVLALIDGEHDGDVGFLFSSQINLDTLEGITRCRAFIAPRPAYGAAENIVRQWARNAETAKTEFDAFWKLKHNVYNLFIGARHGAALDAVAQTYMRTHLSDFSAEDFLNTETTLHRRHPNLHGYLKAATRGDDLRALIPAGWQRQAVDVRKRTFFVAPEAELVDNDSINQRYRQSKSIASTTLSDLLD